MQKTVATNLGRHSAAAMKIIGGDITSMLQCSLVPGQRLLTHPQSVIGVSGNIQRQHVSHGATTRKLASGPFFMQGVTTTDESGAAVLLTPPSSGQVKVLRLEGNKPLHLHRGSFLAASGEDVKINSRFNQGLGTSIDGLFSLQVSSASEASVAITARQAGIHHLHLASDEEYLIRPQYLLAWSSIAKPAPVPEAGHALISLPAGSPLSQMLMYWANNTIYCTVSWMRRTVQTRFTGDKGSFYRLVGPGNFYIATQLPGRLDGFLSAYVGLKEQGRILQEAAKNRPRLSERSYSSDTKTHLQQPSAIVTIDNGKPMFQYLEQKPTLPAPTFISHDNVKVAVTETTKQETIDQTSSAVKSTVKEVVDKIPAAVKSTAKEVVDKIPAAVKETSSWRRLLFGKQ